MQWSGWSEFWGMGGYAFYVWGSFAVTGLLILVEVFLLRKNRNETLKRLKRMRNWEEQ
jgi:heme exporter protein D